MALSPRHHPWGLPALLALAFAVASPLPAGGRQDPGTSAAADWNSTASAVIAAGNSPARLEAVREQLQAAGFGVTRLPFTSGDHDGVNLVAEVAGDPGAPLLLIGAHADRVEVGEGAVDNASGVAVVLALAERLRERPLQGHRVAVAFWDLEERGLLGAGVEVRRLVEHCEIMISDQRPVAPIGHKIDADQRLGAVADDVPEVDDPLHAARLDVRQHGAQRLSIAVDVADDRGRHDGTSRGSGRARDGTGNRFQRQRTAVGPSHPASARRPRGR